MVLDSNLALPHHLTLSPLGDFSPLISVLVVVHIIILHVAFSSDSTNHVGQKAA